MPYRVYVPKAWNGTASLPIVLMLHGAGANESTYLDQADGLLMSLAEQHGYIVVSVQHTYDSAATFALNMAGSSAWRSSSR